jgi:secretion/DNA translocation related TadE-like protein
VISEGVVARSCARERGAAAIVMLGVVAVALSLTYGAARLGSALVGRARAESAADAAALAAADMLALGRAPDVAADAARATAVANGARLVSCRCRGNDAAVVVEVDVSGVGVPGAVARGRARAEVRPECVIDLRGCR